METVYIQRKGQVYPVRTTEGRLLAVFDDERDAAVYAAWWNTYTNDDAAAFTCFRVPLNPDLPSEAQAALDDPSTASYELEQAARRT